VRQSVHDWSLQGGSPEGRAHKTDIVLDLDGGAAETAFYIRPIETWPRKERSPTLGRTGYCCSVTGLKNRNKQAKSDEAKKAVEGRIILWFSSLSEGREGWATFFSDGSASAAECIAGLERLGRGGIDRSHSCRKTSEREKKARGGRSWGRQTVDHAVRRRELERKNQRPEKRTGEGRCVSTIDEGASCRPR